MQTLTIGQVAKQAGLGVETVRYYEREGLIPPPPRSASGYRHYPAESVRRLHFIRHAKALGFSLADIRELLDLRADPRASSEPIRDIAAAKLVEIREKIAALERMQQTLEQLVDECPGHVPTTECPILDALAHPGASFQESDKQGNKP